MNSKTDLEVIILLFKEGQIHLTPSTVRTEFERQGRQLSGPQVQFLIERYNAYVEMEKFFGTDALIVCEGLESARLEMEEEPSHRDSQTNIQGD